MASLPTEEKYGYDDSRFQRAVDENFHCSICYNVLKEPRMCRNNEHIFCRCCITEHLNVNSHTCPECKEDLTVYTLRRAPRLATKYLSELKINCDYFDRGCHEYIRLEELDSHVENCGFAPVKCSNEECELVINKREIIHHESAVCEYRKVKCHSCVKIEQDVKDMQGKIEKESKEIDAIKGDVNEIKGIVLQMFDKLTLLEKTVQMSCSNVSNTVREDIVIVAGYYDESFTGGKTVERFSWKDNIWVKIASLNHPREDVCSFIFGDELCVVGKTDTMEVLNFKKEPAEWNISVSDPLYRREGHCTLVYKNRLILIGGSYSDDVDDYNDDYNDDYGDIHDTDDFYDDDYGDIRDVHDYEDFEDDDYADVHDVDDYNDDDSDVGDDVDVDDGHVDEISEVLLTPPYTNKLLGRMPEPRKFFAAELFENRILIFGGRKWHDYNGAVDSVLEFDLNKNECRTLSSLPQAISGMATVRWGDKVVLIGGRNKDAEVLNQVLVYDSTTEKIDILPSMLEARVSPCAVMTGNMIVVVGGKDAEYNQLASVEGFVLGGYSWEYLPSLNVGRSGATAELVPLKFSKGW